MLFFIMLYNQEAAQKVPLISYCKNFSYNYEKFDSERIDLCKTFIKVLSLD